ncbi:MAG: hypothetical protein PSV24_13440 [Rhodoferax sp.]|nr:hypothetical protein [Rhodoferax sp.]
MAHFLTWVPRGVYAKFVGTCSGSDVERAFRGLSDDARSDQIRYAIFDYLDVDRVDITDSELETTAAFDIGLAYSLPSLRVASVATDEQLLELWRRFVDLEKLPGRHGVFPTVSAAQDWLAQSPPVPNYLRSGRFL